MFGGRFVYYQHFRIGSMYGCSLIVNKGSKYYHTEIGKYLASLDGQGYSRLKNLEGNLVEQCLRIVCKQLVSRENLEFRRRIVGVC